jgi:hypothetical protein
VALRRIMMQMRVNSLKMINGIGRYFSFSVRLNRKKETQKENRNNEQKKEREEKGEMMAGRLIG